MKKIRLSLIILFLSVLVFSVSFSPSCESVVPINIDMIGGDSYEYEIIEGPTQVILDGSNLAVDAIPINWKWIIRVNTDDDDWRTYSVGSGEILTEYLSPGNYSITLFVSYEGSNNVDIFTNDLDINAGSNYFEDDDNELDEIDNDDDEDDDDEDDGNVDENDDDDEDDGNVDENDDDDEDDEGQEDDNDDDDNDEDDEEDDNNEDDDDDDDDENGNDDDDEDDD